MKHVNARTLATMALGAVLAAAAPAQAAGPFDHSDFDALLKKNVVKGMVDYDAFQKAPEFPAYLAKLEKADLTGMAEPERLALLINAYNAYTIQLILSHKERDSIRNINKTLGVAAKGPWHEKLAKVGGKVYHLDNIEQDIIRKEFTKFPNWQRIHYALVCAAMGCPPLRSEAYTADKLDAQLTDQGREFLTASPAKNRVDVAKGIFYSSEVMGKYYRDDFGSNDAAITRFQAQFFPDGPEKTALLGGKLKIETTEYDWTLNSQEKAKAGPAAKAK